MAQVLAYNLDGLGAALFESLVQSLLVAELGLSIEAWGSSGDHGKDAFSKGPLNYPTKHLSSEGPFLFQAKFVAGANAANAKPGSVLLKAIRKEVQAIEKRKTAKTWLTPRHYIVLTNVPITTKLRGQATVILEQALPKCQVSVKGASDISALLNNHPAVARTCPYVISPDAIKWAVFDAVHNVTLQRSDGALKAVADLMTVFVPTGAYEEAWQKLRKHNFVVLEGPPEVGKTAIGWMIAGYLSAGGWQVIDCVGPNDFFALYQQDVKQVFIADDAFGRTEFKVNLSDEWAGNLHKTLPKLNKDHLFVWTTRAHILQAALREMSLQAGAKVFPHIADVLVDARRITRTERAYMLYRHARAAGLEQFAREIVKANADEIVDNPHFTPLRISRFVAERLPSLARRFKGTGAATDSVRTAIAAELKNPTDALRQAFNKLSPQQKWILLAVLDVGERVYMPILESRMRAFGGMRGRLEDELKVLDHAFLSVDDSRIEWIHPSNRDLVIEELELDSELSLKFLRMCSFEGLSLAISHSGGTKGKRSFPLMNSDESWVVLKARLEELLREDTQTLGVLRVLTSAIEVSNTPATVRQNLVAVAEHILTTMRSLLDSAVTTPSTLELEAYAELSTIVNFRQAFPNVARLWDAAQAEFINTVTQAHRGTSLDPHDVVSFARYAAILQKVAAPYFDADEFLSKYSPIVDRLISAVESEANDIPDTTDSDELDGEADRMEDLQRGLDILQDLFPRKRGKLEDASGAASSQATFLREKSAEKREDYQSDDWRDERYNSGGEPRGRFSISEIFRDL